MTFKKLSFSQTKTIANSVNSKQSKDSVLNLTAADELRITGKKMEIKLSNSTIKTDVDIKSKNFIIERSSNIKIDVITGGSKP